VGVLSARDMRNSGSGENGAVYYVGNSKEIKDNGQWKTIGNPNAPDNAIKRIECDARDK
jgi:hypothetical protein